MKLQIDTENKTIKVEEQTNLDELMKWLKTHFTDWKEYKLDSLTYYGWPVVYPTYPEPPIITYGTCELNTQN